MTIRYLNRGVPVTLNSSGVGSGQLSPDTGQWWIPRIIRVGATLPSSLLFPTNQPPLVCQLFHGGTGDTGADAFVDGTAMGTGDVTCLMNGTLIQAGEFLTAQWNPIDIVHGNITASGYLQIIGLTADSVTEATAALSSAVPGPGFTAPISYPMHMPVSASNAALFTFQNPGSNNTVNLINPSTGSYLYMYRLTVKHFPAAVSTVNGIFRAVGGPTFAIAYVDPYSDVGPYTFYYDGMRMNPNGLEFFQLGGGAANSVGYSVTVTHRFLLF